MTAAAQLIQAWQQYQKTITQLLAHCGTVPENGNTTGDKDTRL